MNCQMVEPAGLPQLAREMGSWPGIVFDIETTSLDIYLGARLLSVAVAAWHEADSPIYAIPAEADLRLLQDAFERKPLLAHNIKFDLHGLVELAGLRIDQPYYYDTIVLARLICMEEHPELALEKLAKRFLGYDYVRADVKKKRNQLAKIPWPDVAEYNCEDVWVTRRLYYDLKSRLDEQLAALFQRECQLTADLFNIERRGLTIDQEYLEKATGHLDGKLDKLLADLRHTAGREDFLPSSPQQVAELLSSYSPVKRTGKGKVSWDKEALLENGSSEAVAVARYKGLGYLRNGVFQRCINHLNAGRKQMFGEIKNWGTVTGRLSGDMQQLTKGWLQENEVGEGDVLKWAAGPQKEIGVRRLFKPREGYEWAVIDYRQIEMFVLGYYMKDKTFNRWLEAEDVHAATAVAVWGAGADREDGKVMNFGLVYGLGLFRTAEEKYGKSAMTGSPSSCAHVVDVAGRFHPADPPRCQECCLAHTRNFREQYFRQMPGYNRLVKQVRKQLEQTGILRNRYGRQYMLDPELAYKGVNYFTQGSAGDFVKFRLPATRALRRELGLYVCNTTHDDFATEKPLDLSIRSMEPFLQKLRESPFDRELPLEVKTSQISLSDLAPVEVAA